MKPAPTREFVLDLLDYDPLTGIFTWRVDRGTVKAGTRAGYVNKRGYRVINIGGRLALAHRLAVFHMTGEWPAHDVDHRFGQRDDNRWSELREMTRAGNMENLRRAHRDNKSGLLGVSPCNGRWAAHIRINGKNRYLGTHDTPELAHAVYLAAKRDHHSGNTL